VAGVNLPTWKGLRNMRVPTFILEHPLESVIAGVLLLALLFGSADRHAAEMAVPQQGAQLASTDKM
jgi:hypothetical protein